MDFPRTVYAIQHNKTSRTYIGSSKNPEKRVRSHLSALRSGRHSIKDMQDDFDLYGDDYTITYLEEITDYSDRFHEYDWMYRYNSHIRGKGYNYMDRFTQEKPTINKSWYRQEFLGLLKKTTDLETLNLVLNIWRKLV